MFPVEQRVFIKNTFAKYTSLKTRYRCLKISLFNYDIARAITVQGARRLRLLGHPGSKVGKP
jgi:hypothetical protein